MEEVFEFGIINEIWEPIDFRFGSIAPLVGPDELKEWTRQCYRENATHRTVWMFPPRQYSSRLVSQPGEAEEFQRVEQSERPAFLWFQPPTHSLTLVANGGLLGTEAAHFMVQILGFLYHGRPQISNWKTDLKVPIPEMANRFNLRRHDLIAILNLVSERYLSLTPEHQRTIRNLITLRNRLKAYEWDWERFQWAYTFLDGVYRFLGPLKKGGLGVVGEVAGHRNQLSKLCEDLGILLSDKDEEVIASIVKLRNNLVHEFKWDNAIPGHSHQHDAFFVTEGLLTLVDQLLLYVLDIDCGYRSCGNWSQRAAHPAFQLFASDDYKRLTHILSSISTWDHIDGNSPEQIMRTALRVLKTQKVDPETARRAWNHMFPDVSHDQLLVMNANPVPVQVEQAFRELPLNQSEQPQSAHVNRNRYDEP